MDVLGRDPSGPYELLDEEGINADVDGVDTEVETEEYVEAEALKFGFT